MSGQASHTKPIAVYLPGYDRDHVKGQGLATISENGEISIKLYNREHARRLVELDQQGILYAVGFDYIPVKEKK